MNDRALEFAGRFAVQLTPQRLERRERWRHRPGIDRFTSSRSPGIHRAGGRDRGEE